MLHMIRYLVCFESLVLDGISSAHGSGPHLLNVVIKRCPATIMDELTEGMGG